MRPIFFDTETTGTSPEKDRIIELAAYDPERDLTFERLINPGIEIGQDAMNVHQISNEMVKDAPSFGTVMKEFIDFCSGDVALVAHNLDNFDMPFLQAECDRNDIELPESWLSIDSLIWARRYRPDLPRHSLQFLRKVYGVEANQAHRALNDVTVLYEVYKAMTDDLSCKEIATLLLKAKPKEVEKKPEQNLELQLFS